MDDKGSLIGEEVNPDLQEIHSFKFGLRYPISRTSSELLQPGSSISSIDQSQERICRNSKTGRLSVKSVTIVKLTHDHPKGSSTSKTVHYNALARVMMYSGTLSGCESEMLCYYQVTYGDGSASFGYFMEDYMYYDEVSENHQTSLGNGSVVFGVCFITT